MEYLDSVETLRREYVDEGLRPYLDCMESLGRDYLASRESLKREYLESYRRLALQALVDFAEYLVPHLGVTSGTRGPFFSVHLDTHRLPNGRAFMEVEPGNREIGRLITGTGTRFGRGLAELTPTSDPFRCVIMHRAVEPQAVLEQPHSRLNQAMIIGLFMASELSATAFEIKYEESQMVAYFSMCTVCLMSAMYTARLLAPLEGGTERFSVYLRGFSFAFLGLLRILGVNQASLVTALKIILRMSQVILYWWTAGLLQTYMNAFGMRRN